MIDLQTMLDNAVQAERAREMLTSDQLTLGELTLKLEGLKDKNLPVVFDDGKYKPTGLDSWRGSYRELSLNYEDGGTCYDQPKETCQKDEFGYHDYECPCGGLKEYDTGMENPTAQQLIDLLKNINGKIVIGYKGGDFTMGKTTPVWVAKYGTSSGFDPSEDKFNRAVVNIEEGKDKVSIITKLMD